MEEPQDGGKGQPLLEEQHPRKKLRTENCSTMASGGRSKRRTSDAWQKRRGWYWTASRATRGRIEEQRSNRDEEQHEKQPLPAISSRLATKAQQPRNIKKRRIEEPAGGDKEQPLLEEQHPHKKLKTETCSTMASGGRSKRRTNDVRRKRRERCLTASCSNRTEEHCTNRDEEQQEMQPSSEAKVLQPTTTSKSATREKQPQTMQIIKEHEQMIEQPHMAVSNKKRRRNADQLLLQDAGSLEFCEKRVLRSVAPDKSKGKCGEQWVRQPLLSAATRREAECKIAGNNVSSHPQRRPQLPNPTVTVTRTIAFTKPPVQQRRRRKDVVQQQIHSGEPSNEYDNSEGPVSSRLRSSGCALLSGLTGFMRKCARKCMPLVSS
jgi:hypothetical protein